MTALEGARSFQLVVAATRKMGIGKAGGMPWKLPGDMAYFKELTSKTSDPCKQNAVVMGRKTWESIPIKFRPLAGRINIVLSKCAAPDENCAAKGNGGGSKQAWAAAAQKQGAQVLPSLESALSQLAESTGRVENVFVIGGGQVYAEAICSPNCSAVHLTEIQHEFDCDTYFPTMDPAKWRLWSASPPRSDEGVRYAFLCYVPATQQTSPQLPAAIASRHEEHQYLDMVADVMENGDLRGDRTGTGTFSKFGCQMRFDLRHSFPLLTTKRVFWRGVAEELLWFIRGETNARSLKDRGVHIWDGNSSRQYLDSIGLKHREEDDLGPVYGFQWRHFGAAYKDMRADYTGQGVDQLAEIIRKLRTNPTDRRIILSAWNPAALPDMALPPCHMFAQFYVAHGELSCQMYQRSADLGLGVPFNIASYALLTCLLAHVTDLRPGELVHVLGDAHVYANHVDPLKKQLQNSPRPFPVLKIKSKRKDIEAFTFDELELIGYNPHKKIAMQMAV